MDTSARGGFTTGCFRGTFLVFPLSELLPVSGTHCGAGKGHGTYGFFLPSVSAGGVRAVEDGGADMVGVVL